MRTAEQVFYLAVFSLLGTSHAAAPSKSKSAPANVCEVSNDTYCGCKEEPPKPAKTPEPQCQYTKFATQFEPQAVVSDACASYSTLEQLNDAIHPYLHSITQNTDFFSHYRLSLFSKKCPFWSDENGMCGNVACAVNTLDNEEDIPLVWRADKLGRLEGPTAQHPGKQQQRKKRPLEGSLGDNVDESCVVEYDDECDDRDYCVPEDESATAKGDYVSLVGNPERFTGYAGVGAQQVWEAIYRENCFSKPPKNAAASSQTDGFGGFNNPQQWAAANQLRNVMQQQPLQQNIKSAIAQGTPVASLDPVDFDDTCIEKRVFYRVVSGMHASISTHLCWDYLNQTTGQWSPNLACYEQRLHKFPDRISNIYFNFALIMRAVGKIKRHVEDYSFCSADPVQDTRTKDMVLRLASALPPGDEIFDESLMFTDPDTIALKEDFRNRFRNVSRIMDCVGCDKCRLWGKLQTNGYGTALKVLFEFDENDSSKDPPLRRTELVALLNTMDRLSHSLQAIKEFRRMIDERDGINSPTIKPDPETEGEVLKTKLALEAAAKVDESKDDGMPEWQKHKYNAEQMSFGEICWAEFNLVWRTYVYVLRQWSELPARAFRILIWESGRLWDYWLGLPVPPRGWEIKIPRRNEL